MTLVLLPLALCPRADDRGHHAAPSIPIRLWSWLGRPTATGRRRRARWTARPRSRRRREVRARTLRGDVSQAELVLGLADGTPAASRTHRRSTWPPRCWAPAGAAGCIAPCASAGSSPRCRPTTTPRPSWASSASVPISRPDQLPLAIERIAESVSRLTLLGPSRGRAGTRPDAAEGAMGPPDGIDGRKGRRPRRGRGAGGRLVSGSGVRGARAVEPTLFGQPPPGICSRTTSPG